MIGALTIFNVSFISMHTYAELHFTMELNYYLTLFDRIERSGSFFNQHFIEFPVLKL